MQDRYDRIDIARKELGLTFEDLKDLFEISSDAVRKAIIVRKNLKPIYINRFIEHYGISRIWIESGEGEMKEVAELVEQDKTKKDNGNFNNKKWPLEVLKLLQEQKQAFNAIQKIQDRKIEILTSEVQNLATEVEQLKLKIGQNH